MRPACVRWRAPWFRWAGCEKVDPYPHGRDGHAPFFGAAKSNFKVTIIASEIPQSLKSSRF